VAPLTGVTAAPARPAPAGPPGKPTAVQKTTTVGAEVLPVTARPVGAAPRPGLARIGRWAAAALAFLLPLAAAGAFVRMNSAPEEHGAPAAASAELYAGIEVSSKAVKYTLFEVFPHEEYGSDCRLIANKSTNVNVTEGMDRSGEFSPDRLKDVVKAVERYSALVADEHKVPDGRIHVVASTGLFSPINQVAGLEPEARQTLVARNRAALGDAVKKATGRAVEFVDLEKEVSLQITGVVRKRHRKTALYIDVGGGGTRGGYVHADGEVRKLQGPGVRTFRDKVKARLGVGGEFADAAAALAEKELQEPLRKQVEQDAGLDSRTRIYLLGGINWVLANYMHAANRDSFVKVTARDIEEFADKVRKNPRLLFDFKAPAGLSDREKEQLDEEALAMRTYFPPEDLIAGTQILLALSAELHLESKELYFCRFGDNAWVMRYILDLNSAGR
jgi:hypothetical protein